MRFKKSFALVIAISVLTTTSWASVGSRPASLKLRQPIKVSALPKNGVQAQNRQRLSAAVDSAEKLDQRIPAYLQASSLGPVQRWKAGIDLRDLEKQYTQDLLIHIAAMTEVLRTHRGQQGFAKWQAFEFKNLLAKSDYLLAVPMSRQSLIAQRNSVKIQTMLLEYNRERLVFDGQKIAL